MYSPPDLGKMPASSTKQRATQRDKTPEKIHITSDMATDPQLLINDTGDMKIPDPIITPVIILHADSRLMSLRMRIGFDMSAMTSGILRWSALRPE